MKHLAVLFALSVLLGGCVAVPYGPGRDGGYSRNDNRRDTNAEDHRGDRGYKCDRGDRCDEGRRGRDGYGGY